MSITQVKKQTNENHIAEDKRYFMSGIVKFDIKVAGYDELKKLCEDLMSRTKYFYHLSIRRVSAENLGVQFLYYKEIKQEEEIELTEKSKQKNFILNYDILKQIIEKDHGLKRYAADIDCSSKPDDKLSDRIFIQKELPLD